MTRSVVWAFAARLSVVVGFVASTFLGANHALAGNVRTASLSPMQDAPPPIGWTQFCADYREFCDVPDLRPVTVTLDERNWKELVRINADVNRTIVPVTDADHWGIPEHWDIPTDGQGDCEDYVLEKRRRLLDAGWPRQALLVTVVRDKNGEGHAILTVVTDRGDFSLDNQERKILLWTETGYKFIKRQSQESPNRWVGLGNIDTQLLTAR